LGGGAHLGLDFPVPAAQPRLRKAATDVGDLHLPGYDSAYAQTTCLTFATSKTPSQEDISFAIKPKLARGDAGVS
jgi:hypothetical protein